MVMRNNHMSQFLRSESGATAVEYGLIMGLMTVALVGALGTTGKSNGEKWDGIAEKVENATDGSNN